MVCGKLLDSSLFNIKRIKTKQCWIKYIYILLFVTNKYINVQININVQGNSSKSNKKNNRLKNKWKK